ncbi:MAG TPA: 23S rRNA (guanosine(2251)-2'-O)-methyltransferase RlmB [Vicinamibacterales bacterium]|nr:23S rRNA (guanosine(2251)-2'-O)-methyltransferase RlmB [Vicinamibacterales bacterium]
MTVIYGINPVLEALRAGRARRLRVGSRRDRRLNDVVTLAARLGVAIDHVDRAVLDRAARGGGHQGVVADIETPPEYALADLVSRAPGPTLIVVLDGIEDPQNAGAVLRTADAAGATGLVRQSRHAAALDGVVAKASAGALAHLPIATVVNVARAVEELKASGVWTVGLAAEAPERYDQVDLTLPTALVVGAEGTGLRRLVRERCDRLVAIPMLGAVESLNASVATGVVLYEAARQRGFPGWRPGGPLGPQGRVAS